MQGLIIVCTNYWKGSTFSLHWVGCNNIVLRKVFFFLQNIYTGIEHEIRRMFAGHHITYRLCQSQSSDIYFKLSATGNRWLPVLNLHNALLWRKFNFVRYVSKTWWVLKILYITHFLLRQVSLFHSWRYWSFSWCKITFNKSFLGAQFFWWYHRKEFPLLQTNYFDS